MVRFAPFFIFYFFYVGLNRSIGENLRFGDIAQYGLSWRDSAQNGLSLHRVDAIHETKKKNGHGTDSQAVASLTRRRVGCGCGCHFASSVLPSLAPFPSSHWVRSSLLLWLCLGKDYQQKHGHLDQSCGQMTLIMWEVQLLCTRKRYRKLCTFISWNNPNIYWRLAKWKSFMLNI